MRNKKYYDKMTTMHINSKLHSKAVKEGKKEGLYFYEYINKLLEQKLSK